MSLRFVAPVLSLLAVAACSSVSTADDRGTLGTDDFVQVVVHDPSAVAAYILDLSDGTVALVDTGVDPEAGPLLAALEARGLGPDDVAHIFVTHGHGDHIAGIPQFPDARVWAFAEEEALIAGEVQPERPFPSFGEPEETGIEVTDTLRDGEPVQVGELTVEPFLIPGHTDGSAAFLVAGVLFLGDAASATSAGSLNGATWIFSKDPEQSLESLRALHEQLAARDGDVVDVIACSHSGALADGLAPLRELVEPE